jgi:hypothetical protein
MFKRGLDGLPWWLKERNDGSNKTEGNENRLEDLQPRA